MLVMRPGKCCRLAVFTLALAVSSSCAWKGDRTSAAESSSVPTLPAPPATLASSVIDSDATVTRLAFGSCYKTRREGDVVWDSIAGYQPQLFIFAGDTLYPDKDDSSAALLQLRAAYQELGELAAFARLRKEIPILPIWDDHDYGMNDGGGDFPFRVASELLFEDAWALDASDPRRRYPGVYFSQTVGKPGKRLQIIVLDTRYFRSPLKVTEDYGAKGKERYVPDASLGKTMLGDVQWRWLEAQMQAPADLRLIVSTVQVLADGHGWEGWKQLPRERDRLFTLLQKHQNAPVILLSGDRHVAGFYQRDIGLSMPLIEFTSSALNNTTPFPYRSNTLAEAGPYRLGELFGEANFGAIDIDWKAGLVTLSLRSASGEVVRKVRTNIGI